MHFGGKSYGEAPQETPPKSSQGPAVSSKARSENMRDFGRALLTASPAGVVFPAQELGTYPLPDAFLQLRNRATSPMPASCVVARLLQNDGG